MKLTRLQASTLSCIKRDRLLFDNLDVALGEGQMLVVSGPNGAGKTSLLRILAGIAMPESGEVVWNGQSIYAEPSAYNQDMLYIGHKLGFSPNLSAFENIAFWLQQRQVEFSRSDILDVIDNLALIGMDNVLVRQMSAGQQRRVALAKLWLAPATLWILDEPLTALDKFGITLLQQKMIAHVQAGGMIISTSHQQFDVNIPITVLELESDWV